MKRRGFFGALAGLAAAIGLPATKPTVLRWPDDGPLTVEDGGLDLWGDTWTAADVNDANFGFQIAASSIIKGVTIN